MGTPSFTCICLQKRLVLRNKEEVQREQQRSLQRLVEQYECEASAVLSGGCLISTGSAIGKALGTAAVVLGSLDSHAVAMCLPDLTSEVNPLTDAEFICHMYKKFGRMVPQKLKGNFSFVLFDPAQERVLAAASPTSPHPIIQARGADGSLVITTASPSDLPLGSHSMLAISPGYMKYGWSSDPQQYAAQTPQTPPRRVLSTAASASAHAAKMALSGILDEEDLERPSNSGMSVQTSRASFAESEGPEPQSPAPKKTRRGKRGGRNQKLRAESLKRVSVDELGRASIDFASLASLTPSASSMTSRADEQNWWRTNTPRQSMELPSFPSSSLSSSLVGSQGFTSPNFRRFSMSATAPTFVPGQPGLYSRQSVPSTQPRVTALKFPERASTTKRDSAEGSLLVASDAVSTIDNPAMVSPFSDGPWSKVDSAGTSKVGKADAAWEESSDSQSSKQLTSTSQTLSSKTQSSLAQGKETPSKASTGFSKGIDNLSGDFDIAQQPKILPRIAIGSHGSQKDHTVGGGSPVGGSPRGLSPGGSPTKPPKIPMNAFRHLLKTIIPKRSSQVDLWAEAGLKAGPQRIWAKSSSHGNLVDLHGASQHLDHPGYSSGKATMASTSEVHQMAAREDAVRRLTGRLHDPPEDYSLETLKVSEQADGLHRQQPSAAQWLAQKTRNIFGKSKSCTDLHKIDRPQTFSPLGMEVK